MFSNETMFFNDSFFVNVLRFLFLKIYLTLGTVVRKIRNFLCFFGAIFIEW
jgi:hypothetical protein